LVEGGENLRVYVDVDHPVEFNQQLIPAGLRSQGGFTLISKEPLVVEDFAAETRFEPAPAARQKGIRSGLSVVIEGRERVFGVLVTQSTEPGRFKNDDTTFLSAVADILSSALERQRTEEALRHGEERYHALVRVSAQILWTTTAEGVVIDIPEWSAFTGQTTEELSGFGWLDAIHPQDRERVAAQWRQSVATKGVYATEYRMRKRDGSYEHFFAQGVPLLEKDGSVRGWVGANANITARKRAEEALHAAKVEAEAANTAKSGFLSRMSHELRTPLNAILGFGQILEISELDPRSQESVGHILRAGRHLLSLIDEVLAISRIEAGYLSLSLEPVSVVEIAQECLSLVSRQAAARQIRCENRCTVNHYIHADRQRLRQVLLNLLSNAIKYNLEGGKVTLSCHQIPAASAKLHAGKENGHAFPSGDAHWLRMEVVDMGNGLTAEEIGRLFTPFERLNAERSMIKGTGLGLALSKGLVEAMGGAIGADSIPEKGSTFWLELPLTSDPSFQFETSLEPVGPSSLAHDYKGTVLYIEDNLSNLRLIEMLLEEQPGFELLSAQQGALGLEIARARRPDLILLDLHLPDLPGWEVLAQLEADERLQDVPVVIISADATSKQIARLLEAGARDYLTKPIDVGKLMRTLDEHLSRRSSSLTVSV
jgi:PAS domain S-box-containing protein